MCRTQSHHLGRHSQGAFLKKLARSGSLAMSNDELHSELGSQSRQRPTRINPTPLALGRLFGPGMLRRTFLALGPAIGMALSGASGGGLGVTPGLAQAGTLSKEQEAARAAYEAALRDFKEVLAER